MHNFTLAMIVKDEAPNIEECLKSVVKFVDYYIIADTGSTDNTKQIIKDFFDAHNIKGEILDHPWEDFGTNRSKVLKHCHGKTKWVIMIDADDYVEGEIDPSKFDDSLDGYVTKIARGEMIWYRAQIFNLGKKLWWYEEPLHEYAVCEQPMNVQKLEGNYSIVARTQGCRARASRSDKEKYLKDYCTLKSYLEKDPNQPRKQFYAAQSAFDSQLFDVAEREYLQRIKLGHWPEEIAFSWMRIGICREIMGKPFPEVVDAFMQSYEARPIRAEPLWHLSCLYRKYNRPCSAFLVASQALNIPVPEQDILFVDYNVYKWGILDEIATTAFYVGKYQLGLSVCHKLLTDKFIPEIHHERLKKNKEIYEKILQEGAQNMVNKQFEEQQKMIKKMPVPQNQTTFGKDLSKLKELKL